MPYEHLESATLQLANQNRQLHGIITALATERLSGSSPRERALRAELAHDSLRLLEDAEAAITSGAPAHTVATLLDAINELTSRLRDRLLDSVVASSPVPDRWPL
ncbi:hypothetical protein [Streptomyces sp. NPDC058330]|uniref:hypothetical protein n=1 Tax=Streptomyces sp. NPDC058330 TaxID=3346449 RepID=UPI0036EA1228